MNTKDLPFPPRFLPNPYHLEAIPNDTLGLFIRIFEFALTRLAPLDEARPNDQQYICDCIEEFGYHATDKSEEFQDNIAMLKAMIACRIDHLFGVQDWLYQVHGIDIKEDEDAKYEYRVKWLHDMIAEFRGHVQYSLLLMK